MSVDKKFLKNTQNSFQLLAQKGGRGRSATFDSMNTAATDGLGKYPARGVLYESCDSQSGGGGYGFTQASVKNADTFRGSYPEYVKYDKPNQCGGKRRKKRKTKRRRKSRRRKSRRRKSSRRTNKKKCCKLCKKLCSKTCKKKCKKQLKKCKCKCKPCKKFKSRSKRGGRRSRRTRRRTRQRGGSSQVFSSPNPQHNLPWATGPMSIQKLPPTCFDNYNHYTGKQRQ